MDRQVATPCFLRMGQDEWDQLLEEWDAAARGVQAAKPEEKTVAQIRYDSILRKIEDVRRMVARDMLQAWKFLQKEYPDEWRKLIAQTVAELVVELAGGSAKELAIEAGKRVIYLREEIDRLTREVFELRSKLGQMTPPPPGVTP